MNQSESRLGRDSGPEEPSVALSSPVWADLKALRFLNQLKDDVRSLKASQSRLQGLFLVAISLLTGTVIALGVVLGLTYQQLQQVQQSLERPRSNSVEVR